MANYDLPMESSPPPEEPTYPDIDETIHYPWQDRQRYPTVNEILSSAIDPRLFPPQDARPAYSQQPSDMNEDEVTDDTQSYPPPAALDGVDTGDVDDSDFVYTENESESEDEDEEDESPDDGDDDDSTAARRRRRRRRGGRFSGRYGARGAKGVKRGPRRAIEPGPEFKQLHSEATEAFIEGDYDRAIELIKQAILVNPEMFSAHSLLSEIFLAKGQKDKSLAALWNGAHTRPRVLSVWLKVARLILERAGEDRKSVLNDVIYCYSRVLEIDPQNVNVRYQRAAIYRELAYNGRAATEYERILRDQPNSARALRHVAEIFIDLHDVPRAIKHWSERVEDFTSRDPGSVRGFSWSDANIYAELFGYVGRHEDGLHALKLVSRWLLGRKDDEIWEDFQDDDREWDLDDSPRRIKTDGFLPDQWPQNSYGLGLPLELRTKMGLFRLKMGEAHHSEALDHFEWLNPDDSSENARVYDYGDLFREVADALRDAGLLDDALRFYSPIQNTPDYADISFYMAMADCCMQLGKVEDAETCYLTVAEHDARNMESRVELAKLYESLGLNEQALQYVNEAVLVGRQKMRTRRRRRDNRLEQLALEFKRDEEGATLRPIAPRPSALTWQTPISDRPQVGESARTATIQFLYAKMRQLEPQVKEGVLDAIEDWLDIADALLRDFRSNSAFYPMARTIEFQGYSAPTHRRPNKPRPRTVIDEMKEMAGRLQKSMGGDSTEEPLQGVVPTDYHGIPFEEWLDLFLQFALRVTEQGEPEEAYENLDAASIASIWFHSKHQTRIIHVCWLSCALRAQDEETVLDQARWFIKEYQFVTDTYRLFAMLSNVIGDPQKSLFHSSPSMKFVLRQIKAMDFTLPETNDRPRPARQTIWKERASLSTKDENGKEIPAYELDVALLMLYGQILYSGASFFSALNYFFRAYALDDQNPAVLLSIALSYIHTSLKRQSDNRHYHIMQGLSFMHEYRRAREKPGALLQEKQEMEFNFARVWQGLGLNHLAIQGYKQVLELGEQIQQEHEQACQTAGAQTDGTDVVMSDAGDESPPFVENFSHEAAFALQTMYVLGGDAKAAQDITEKYLVI